MRKLYSILILTQAYIAINGQGNDDFTPAIFSPSPNVMEMTRYLDQTVDNSTGIPSISVPIYTIQQGDIQVPVTLSYYAGGIKVEQEATNVGLGWSLNAGGVVSREIRSIIDDLDPQHDFGGFMYQVYKLRYFLTLPQNNPIVQQSLQYGQDRQFDLEADMFSYALPTASGGQFQFDQDDRKFYENEITNNRIQYSTGAFGKIYEWTITDPKGVKYYFGEINEGSYYNPVYSETNYRSVQTPGVLIPAGAEEPIGIVSWYLRKIIDAKGNEVNFDYTVNALDDVEYIQRIPKVSDRGVNVVGGGFYSINKVKEKRISKISFKNGFVEFVYDTVSRQDLKNSKRLQSIRIYSTADGNTQNAVLNKVIELDNNHYFDSIITNGQSVDNNYNDYNTKRLKLESVKFKIPTNLQQIMEYRFEYNPNPLPQKFSYAQDYWGGYNHENENERLFPEMVFVHSTNGSLLTFQSSFGTERAVNKNYVTAGTLTKIIYPTGGYTKYSFEPNTISDYDYLPSYTNVPEYIQLKNVKNPYKLNVFEFSNYGGPDNKCTKTIENTNKAYYLCKINISNSLQSKPNLDDYYFGCPNGSITTPHDVFPPADGEIYCNFREPTLIDGNGNDMLYSITSNGIVNNSQWAAMPPGEYYVKIKFNGSLGILDNPSYSDTYFHVNVKIKEDETPLIRTIGGIRVNKIQNFDSNNQLIGEKEYQYEFTEGNIKLSTGKGILPKFGMYESFPIQNTINYITPYTNNVFYMSEANLNPFYANKVQYSKVVEKIKDIQNNEYTTKEYSSFNPLTMDYSNFYNGEDFFNQYYKKADISWYNKPVNEEYKDKENNPVMQKGYTNSPVYIYTNGAKGFYTGIRQTNLALQLLGSNDQLLKTKWNLHHHAISSYSVPTAATIMEYRANGTVTTLQNFAYSANNPLLLSSEVTTSPDLTTTEIVYAYAHDKGKTLLTDANMIGIPLEKVTKKGSKIISKAYTDYPDVLPDTQTGNLLLPKSISALDLITGNMSTEVTYNQYDTKGNIQQYTTKDGTSTAIIWGYDQTQPIAKIDGAMYSQVSSLATTIINASNTDASAGVNNDESALLIALDNFRKDPAMTKYKITTYTYDPLIGVRSITPPSGVRENYIYDTANRLEKVVDINGHILKEYKYNYKQ
ncbi:MAG: hypothetical protein E2590_15445 [Chryseobacterium sp.]|nr:hypothetical protein [Chryseobacterium sp.]